MQLSIITVTHNSGKVLPLFLAGMGDVPPGVELILVDSGSQDLPDVRTAAKRSKALLAAVPENVGYGFGSNLGARLAQGKWLAFVNPDVEISVDDLLALVQVAETQGLAVIGPTIRSHCGEAPPSARPLVGPLWRRPSWEFPEDDGLILAPSMSGCCMLVRGDMFARVDGFDPRFFMFAEETDLHLRLHELGAVAGVSTSIAAYTEGGGGSEGVSSAWANVQRAVSRVLYSFKNLSITAGLVDFAWRLLQLLLGDPARWQSFELNVSRNPARVASLKQFLGELKRARRLRKRRVEDYLNTLLLEDGRSM